MDFVVYELHSLVFICSIGKSRLHKPYLHADCWDMLMDHS